MPVAIKILRKRPGVAPGAIFLTPQSIKFPGAPQGLQIIDDRGTPVWFRTVPSQHMATDLRVQSYRGQRVLTWWEGVYNTGGVWRIADSRYRVIATVRGVSAPAHVHEFVLTPRGTALLIEYPRVRTDLTAAGGPAEGTVVDGVIEEIDVATGKSLWRWSSLDHIPISETYLLRLTNGENDYAHLNSIDVDGKGDLLVCARYTSTVYKVDRRTGRIVWRLGGRDSTFQLGPGVRFTGQHHAAWAGKNLIRLFDNGNLFPNDQQAAAPGQKPLTIFDRPPGGLPSRVIWIRLDPERKTAELVREVRHPQQLAATIQGSTQQLPNGNLVVGWGQTGRLSEFSPDGRLLFDASLPHGFTSYRVYRFPWTGRPLARPTAIARAGSVRAVWNGATDVARWRVLTGPAPKVLRRAVEARWNGLDTAIRLPAASASHPYVKVVALNATGKVLGVSAVTRAVRDRRRS